MIEDKTHAGLNIMTVKKNLLKNIMKNSIEYKKRIILEFGSASNLFVSFVDF